MLLVIALFFPGCILLLEDNAFYCTSRFGVKLEDICYIDKQLIRSYVEAEYSDNLIHSVVSLLEMLFIKFNYHLLSLLSRNEINDAIQCLSKTIM